jgi:putative spermidine/putrescine transport system permease protein
MADAALPGSPAAISGEPRRDAAPGEVLRTADGRPLKAALARSSRRARLRAFLLVAPLLAFVLVTFAIPIGQMLYRSVHNVQFAANMPELVAWFAENPQGAEIDESAFAALASDLRTGAAERRIGTVATRINYEVPGTRSLFTGTARRAATLEAPYREALLEINADWGRPDLWQAMRGASSRHTANFYLAAVDRKRDIDGSIVQVQERQRVYVQLFWRTLLLSLVITTLTLILGFPVAHLLATLPLRTANL